MGLFEDTNPRPVKELLAEIHGCTMVLPDFQRDFVWDPGATQELIVSIANNYPAGSILRVRNKGNDSFFAAREFEGAPTLDERIYTFLVLDGQQRLTSLYQAFYGVGEHRYFLNLNELMEGADFEEALFHERATTKTAKALCNFEVQAEKMTLPLSVLKGGAGGFLQWMFTVTNPKPADERARMIDALHKVHSKWIMTIDDYHFPVVTLADNTGPSALCTIFETLNRTGVKLNVFELLTARFWPLNIRLRDLWEKAIEDHPIISDLQIDPYYVLQAIALISHKSCKRKEVLDLVAANIETWWQPVVTGLAEGLTILRDDCNVMLPKWLPYSTMVVPLAAVLGKAGIPKNALAGAQREKIKRWFWCAVYGQAYEKAPNSQSGRDFNELLDWFEGGPVPETVARLTFDPNTLRSVTPRQRSIYRGTICLILGSGTGARDFHTQAVITGKLMNEEGIDDHHVFPDKYLKKQGISQSFRRDCILNRTLIDRTTNQMISARAPSDYMAEIRNTKDFPFDLVLNSHCLPTGDSSPLWTDDFEFFLSWRQHRLWQEIKRVTGITEAADLEAEEGTA